MINKSKEQESEIRDSSIKKNSWYHFNNEGDTAIVFIHGFLSDIGSCWSNKTTFWPELIIEDSRLKDENYSIYLAQYYTAADSGIYSIRDCSNEVFLNLSTDCTEHQASVLSKQNIIFVCHSLGGIVARHIVEFNQSQFFGKKVGFVLIGSPSLGSAYADIPLLKSIGKFYNNTVAKELQESNSFLIDLDSRFRKLISDQTPISIVGIEALENHPPFHIKYLPSRFSPIVNLSTGNRYFLGQTIPNTTHSSIVKPSDNQQTIHLLLIKFLTKEFRHSCTTNLHLNYELNKSKSEVKENKADVLFDVLNRNATQFYLTRQVDARIQSQVYSRSIWLYGESGSGKTTAIRSFLFQNEFQPVSLCISHLKDKFDETDLYNEILITAKHLGFYHGQAPLENPRPELIEFISSYSELSPIVIYLDEVPLPSESESMQGFLTGISTIINSACIRSTSAQPRIFFSSIESPEIAMQNYPKSIEQIALIKLDQWSKNELEKLINLITLHLDELTLTFDEKSQLLEKAAGSPRFIKNFFRYKLSNNHFSFEQLLSRSHSPAYAY